MLWCVESEENREEVEGNLCMRWTRSFGIQDFLGVTPSPKFLQPEAQEFVIMLFMGEKK